ASGEPLLGERVEGGGASVVLFLVAHPDGVGGAPAVEVGAEDLGGAQGGERLGGLAAVEAEADAVGHGPVLGGVLDGRRHRAHPSLSVCTCAHPCAHVRSRSTTFYHVSAGQRASMQVSLPVRAGSS